MRGERGVGGGGGRVRWCVNEHVHMYMCMRACVCVCLRARVRLCVGVETRGSRVDNQDSCMYCDTNMICAASFKHELCSLFKRDNQNIQGVEA